MKKVLLGVLVSVIMLGQTAQAVTLGAVDTGIFSRSFSSGGLSSHSNYKHDSGDMTLNYALSLAFGGSITDDNAFAIFDLSGITGTVISASIEMTLSSTNFQFPVDPGSFVFNEVSSDPALFNSSYFENSNCIAIPSCNPLSTGSSLYSDIGLGPVLGSVTYAGLGSQTAVMGTAGIDLINLGLGGLFAVGINGGNSGFGNLTFATPQLTFEVAAVPVPGAIWLFGSALAGLIGFGKRRQHS
ncbi:MAG: hypothetical protein ACI9B9_001238 [Halioglobus sp.]|jgi:hypothetical protein